MAYACPVCATLAPDAEHLAHHLAIVAMTRGGEHEAWLDEHAGDWRESGPDELGPTAVEHAETVDHELADASAAEHPASGHDHDAESAGSASGRPDAVGGGDRSASAGREETAAVLAEAREITQRMLGEDEPGDSGDRDDESIETDTDE